MCTIIFSRIFRVISWHSSLHNMQNIFFRCIICKGLKNLRHTTSPVPNPVNHQYSVHGKKIGVKIDREQLMNEKDIESIGIGKDRFVAISILKQGKKRNRTSCQSNTRNDQIGNHWVEFAWQRRLLSLRGSSVSFFGNKMPGCQE